MLEALKAPIEALFRVLFTYTCEDAQKLPPQGPAVVAANHPSYLDPVLLSLRVSRPIRFMAWDALFRIPFLGVLLRAFGAFPVDIGRGKGRQAYARAKALVEAGEVVGIFPEGRRSSTGWMEPALREGAARLAIETGAPLVPASIAGAYRAWPHFQSLPRPARIKVRFHDPIDPLAFQHLPDEEAASELLAELRKRVERSLLPGVKADLRMNLLYRTPSPWPRTHEYLLALGLALLVFWKTRSFVAVAPAYAYLAYLFLDHLFLPQTRLIKWIRNASPVLFLLAYGPRVLRTLDLPPTLAGAALTALTLGALFPYLYEHGNTALSVIRGLVATAGFELGALAISPHCAGPHLALPLFLAAFAWERRSVFWAWSVPILVCYAIGVFYLLDGTIAAVPHVIAGLLGWLLVRLFPYRPPPPAVDEPSQTGLGLGLDS